MHIHDVIDRYLQGELTGDDREELLHALASSVEARREFWRMAGTHAALREWGKASWGRRAARLPQRPWYLFRVPQIRIAASLLLAVMGALGSVVWFQRIDSAPTNPAAVARVTAVSDAVWHGSARFAKGSQLASGPLRLLDGSAQVTFASGAMVVLNGSVDLDIVNERRIFLRSGKITPFVPSDAAGFTVVSPSGEVVDLGTEFSIGVDATGKTEIYVIDGSVKAAAGHVGRPPLEMTQGFGATLAGPAAATPALTLEPIVIDHFDLNRRQPAEVSGVDSKQLRWIDVTPDLPAAVRGGNLVIPIDDDLHNGKPSVQILLDHDFSSLVGRRSKVAFKATLPPVGTAGIERWVALVISDDGASPEAALPLAHWEETQVAMMVSPAWQAGLRIQGEPVYIRPFFPRHEPANGPYQVVLSIDDTQAGHTRHGSATVDVMVNGVEVITDRPITFGSRPRIGFHTFSPHKQGGYGKGLALIDDFSVSVESADPSTLSSTQP